MSRPLTAGIYRERQDVCGPNGLARVERDPQYPRGHVEERYTVRFYAREAPTGHMVAICYRLAIPETYSATLAPTYDGGWIRALAIAEDFTLGTAREALSRTATR